MATLFPVINASESSNLVPEQLSYGRSPVFDYDTGEFKFDLDGTIVTNNKQSILLQAIRNALLTPRNKIVIYTQQYGSDLNFLPQSSFPNSVKESRIPAMMTEALLVDDRISGVNSYVFDRQGDSFIVEFKVVDKIRSGLVQAELAVQL